MQPTTRHRRFLFAAALFACGSPLAAQAPISALPAVALPPLPMGTGMMAQPNAAPIESPRVEPVGYQTQSNKPTAAPTQAPPPPVPNPSNGALFGPKTAPAPSPATAPAVPAQTWRWYGYGTLNAQPVMPSMPSAPPTTVKLDPPTGWATAPPPAAPMTPANIGVPEKSTTVTTPEPNWNNAPPLPTPSSNDGPAMPMPVPVAPPIAPPTTDLRLSPSVPMPKPAAAPDPLWGTPSSKAPAGPKTELAVTSWQPSVARGSSQQ